MYIPQVLYPLIIDGLLGSFHNLAIKSDFVVAVIDIAHLLKIVLSGSHFLLLLFPYISAFLWNNLPLKNWLHLLSPFVFLPFFLQSIPVMPSHPSFTRVCSQAWMICVAESDGQFWVHFPWPVYNFSCNCSLSSCNTFPLLVYGIPHSSVFPTFLPGYCFSVSSLTFPLQFLIVRMSQSPILKFFSSFHSFPWWSYLISWFYIHHQSINHL